jgi:hypothetical protein
VKVLYEVLVRVRYYGREIPVGCDEIALLDLPSLWILLMVSLLNELSTCSQSCDDQPRSCLVVLTHHSQGNGRCQP